MFVDLLILNVRGLSHPIVISELVREKRRERLSKVHFFLLFVTVIFANIDLGSFTQRGIRFCGSLSVRSVWKNSLIANACGKNAWGKKPKQTNK